MESGKAITDAEKIRRVLGAMALENLYLSEDTIRILSDCIKGEISFDEGRRRILESVGKSGDFGGKHIFLSGHKSINQ